MPREIGSLVLYSVDDLNEKLGLSKLTIRKYLREGKIKGRKLGVQWYVTEQALRAYFDEPASPQRKEQPAKSYHYIVQGVNDLVSEKEECDTLQETISCINEQAIISLFQVAIIDNATGDTVELLTARDFLKRHK